MQIQISKKYVRIEMGSMSIKLPHELALVTRGSRILAIRFPSSGAVVPITFLLQNGVKITIDKGVPYHL